MSGGLSKLRSGFSRRMDDEGTGLMAHRDYEFERRTTDMSRLAHALAHFDVAVTQGMVAMKEIASSFEAVGQAFAELTLGSAASYEAHEPAPYPAQNEDLSVYNHHDNDHNHPRNSSMSGELGAPTPEGSQQRHVDASGNLEGDVRGYRAASVASTRLTDETNGQVRRLAQIFAEETRRMNEGQPFQTYNAGMHRDVVTRLRPVSEHLKSVEEYRQKRTEALQKYNRYKAEVEKVERRYAKKGKPFCDSKSHKKCTEKRDEAWKEYVKRRDKFNETFSLLMEVNDHAAAQIIHRYLALNDEYLRQLVNSIERILPAMVEAYPLNEEYSSAQSALIVEAIANARAPFAKHHAEGEPEARAQSTSGEEGREGDAAAGAGHSSGSPSLPSSPLEEPSTDGIVGGDAEPQGPLMGEAGTPVPARQPPQEDSDETEGDAIAGAARTAEEPGYMLTQASRLHTHVGAAGEEPSPTPALPGAADP